MAHLQRSVAALRIFGDDLAPDEISRLLKAPPTEAYTKGDEWHTAGGVRARRCGGWRLHAEDTEPENLDMQVTEFLGRVTSDLSVWTELSDKYRVDLFCGWFMGSSNEGVEISAATMVALGERGITLSLDIYGPDGEDEVR